MRNTNPEAGTSRAPRPLITFAGIGVWRGARSAPLVVVLLEAVAAIAVALLIAVYVKRGFGAPGTLDETTSTRMRRFG